ncbi:MAG: Fic family protein [Flavobacterium sp.]
MALSLNIIPTDLLEQYVSEFNPEIKQRFESLRDSELSIETFSFYTSVSAVFSSKIEGEKIDLDSFIKHKRFGIDYQSNYTQKIDDLYEAYIYAQNNVLSSERLGQAHSKITEHILKESQQGKVRASNMSVITDDGRIEYVAATPDKVESEMFKFYNDLNILIKADLSFQEVFFFASMLHLVFVKIHPFDDGNGRTARLLEKWFLAQKLGINAWFVESERNYYDNHQSYYKNIRRLGLEYDELNYREALPFLQMLTNSINK